MILSISLALLPWLILLLALQYMYSLWSRGRTPDLKHIKVAYQPPAGVDAGQAGLLIDHCVDAKDIAAILVELEQDGYITSKEDEFIRLMKDPDEHLPAYKQFFLNELFKKGPLIFLGSTLSVVQKLEIQRVFFAVEDMLYQWSVEQGYLRKDAQKERRKVDVNMLMLVPVEMMAFAYTAFLMNTFDSVSFIGAIFLFLIQLMGITMFKKDASWGDMIGGGVVFLLGTIPQYFWFNNEIPIVYGIPGFFQSALLPTALLLLAHIRLQSDLPLRSAKGSKAFIQLLGYKEFLQRVEKGILENNANDATENPRALGFAVALGVKTHWFDHLQRHLHLTKKEEKSQEYFNYARTHGYSL